MLEVKTQALILEKNLGYNNEGHLLLFSEEKGLIWVTGSGIWKSGAKLSAWSDPPTFVEANLIFHEKQNYSFKLLNFSPLSYFSHIRSSYENLSWFFFYVFIIKNFLPVAVSNIHYFEILKEVLKDEDSWKDELSRDLNFGYFLSQILGKEGLCPNWRICIDCQEKLEDEGYFIASCEQGLLCKNCLKKNSKRSSFSKNNISLEFLKILPENNYLVFPKGVLRIKFEERELLRILIKSDSLKTVFANLNSSTKIKDQTIIKVRNFLLLFLGTII